MPRRECVNICRKLRQILFQKQHGKDTSATAQIRRDLAGSIGYALTAPRFSPYLLCFLRSFAAIPSPLFQSRNRFIVRSCREPAAPGSGSGGAIENDRIRAGRKCVTRRILPAIKANGAPDAFKELVLFNRREMNVTTHAPSRMKLL